MRAYSQISPTWWTGQTGRDIARRALTERGDADYAAALEVRIVGDWLMTGSQHDQYGLYYALPVIIQAETGIRPCRVLPALATLGELEFADFDELTSFVWVREMAAWQLGTLSREGKNGKPDNRIDAARRWYRACADNPFLGAFFDRYAEDLWLTERREMKGLGRGSKGAPKPPVISPSPDLDLVGTSGREHERGGHELANGQVRLAALEVVALWNRLAREPFERIAENPASLGRVSAALRARPELDSWERLFRDEVLSSKWLGGQNPRAWVADFWWVLEHLEEVAAGRYRDRVAKHIPVKSQQTAAAVEAVIARRLQS